MSLPPLPLSNSSSVDLSLVEEISRSVLSNLDRDSLINSILTLLHQIFNFSKVNIFTAHGSNYQFMRKIGISEFGLDPETDYYFENDNNPVGWCVAHHEFINIDDISASSQFPATGFDDNTRSELLLPLIQGDLFLGVLELCANTKSAFVPETVQAFKLLADRIAIALRNANLYRSEQISRLAAERLQDAIGIISIDSSLDDIFSRIISELESFFPSDGVAIWTSDSFSMEIGIEKSIASYHLAAVRLKNPSLMKLFEQYLIDPTAADELMTRYPWMDKVIKMKLPLVRSQACDYEPLGALLGFGDQYSAIAAPLTIHSQNIGIISCAHHLPDQYDGESISLLKVCTSYIAMAIENYRLYDAAHAQAWVSTVILQVAEATQSITNLDDLLDTVVKIMPDLIGVDALSVFLWDSSTESFQYKASNGFDEEQTTRLKAWDLTSATIMAFDILKGTRSPVILDINTIQPEVAAAIFPYYDLEKDLLILFPLVAQNSLGGAILVDFINSELDVGSPQAVWDEKYTLIQGAVHQVAIAIENLQLIKSQEEEAYISVALLQVAQAVVSLSDLEEILATIVRITPILVGIKRCIIYIWDEKTQSFHQSQYFGFSKNDLELMGQVIKAHEFPLLKEIQKQGMIIYYPLSSEDTPASWNEISSIDYHVLERMTNDTDEDIPIKFDKNSFTGMERLLIGFPLSVKTKTLGVMLIEEEHPLRGYPSANIREKRIQIVNGITQQAAIAIQNELLQQEAVNSERMERELQLAREIQAAFLPDKIPDLPGWDIDARWQPAREVGGDFYDIIMLGDHKIGFVIADVADKGMPAALFMTLIRTLIRAAAKDKPSPAAVVKQVNELLIPDSKHGMFVTVFYGVISLNTGSLVYANAGHNPPIMVHHNNRALIELPRTTMALGIFEDIEVEEREVLLNPGDWIFLYTDGISEAFSPRGEMFGVQRLQNLLSKTEFSSSQRVADLVIDAVHTFIHGVDLSDDITLGVIGRKMQ
jgi:sigma-B regulation protein RsbU (phosphoserine phosphatase)